MAAAFSARSRGHFAATVSEQVAGLEGPIRAGRRQYRLHAPVIAIDRLIDVLEVRTLAGLTTLCGCAAVDQDLAHLSRLIPLPHTVTGASSTVDLHAALLDLQEPALRALTLSRRDLPRDDLIDSECTDPVAVRRRSSG